MMEYYEYSSCIEMGGGQKMLRNMIADHLPIIADSLSRVLKGSLAYDASSWHPCRSDAKE